MYRQKLTKVSNGFIDDTVLWTDWLGFNGTFSTNRLYCAFKKHVAVNEKVDNVMCWKHI